MAMEAISILKEVVEQAAAIRQKAEDAKNLKKSLSGFSKLLENVAKVVLHGTENSDQAHLSRPDVKAALQMFANAIKDCLDLAKDLSEKSFFLTYLKSSSYKSQLESAKATLSFKLLLLNTAISLVAIQGGAAPPPALQAAVATATVVQSTDAAATTTTK